ncbi:MAG: hypothetical protein MSD82_12385 [Prevotella sp.]|nr:hypothetical protein [Prevotella sp.]
MGISEFKAKFATSKQHKMGFEIVEMEDLSGPKARIYSVVFDGDKDSLLEQFFNENESEEELLEGMLDKIRVMANRTGCLRQFFKEGEGKLADGVVALAVDNIRLYGIYFNRTVILFGSGGIKNVRAYQDDPNLNAKVEQIKYVASKINRAILDRDIKISEDGVLDCENFELYG